MKKHFLLLLITLLSFTFLYAQLGNQNQTNVNNIIPPSPEASQLGKYVEIPVGYYTGVPETSIPLYEIKQGGLSVPISLSYHAGGIKVEEFASWVGIGWTLNCGGVITRVIRGLPDDKSNQMCFQNLSSQYSFAQLVGGPRTGFNPIGSVLSDIYNGCADAEPDLFMFNFNGYTGKMMFNWNGQIVVSCNKSIKVQDIRGTDNYPNRIIGWDITTEEGTIYKFRDCEKTQARFIAGQVCHSTVIATSSWFLSDIVDVNNENNIHLEYDDYTQSINYKSSTSIKDYPPTPSLIFPFFTSGEVKTSSSINTYYGKRIKKITTSSGVISAEFIAGVLRTDNQDLYNPTSTTDNNNFRSLGRLSIKDNNLVERGGFNFNYDYSTARLTLKTIVENFNGQSKPAQEFSYETGYLPSINSTSQDHWGFANTNSSSNLVPSWLNYVGGSVTYTQGANRSPNLFTTKIGTLNTIKYPTGGKVQFLYEQNDYGFVQVEALETLCHYDSVAESKQIQSGSNFDPNNTGVKSITINIVEKPLCLRVFPLYDSVLVSVNWEGFNYGGATLAHKPWISITAPNGNDVFFKRFGTDEGNNTTVQSGTFYKVLLPGIYTLNAFGRLNTTNPPELPPNYASIAMQYYKHTNLLYKRLAGGLRIKKIIEKDSDADIKPRVRSFYYNQNGDVTRSSGVIYQEPRYEYSGTEINNYQYLNSPSAGGVFSTGTAAFSYIHRMSQNVTSLGATQGSHIGYKEVSVVYGETIQSGKSIFKFTSPTEYGDIIAQEIPFAPPISQSFATGLLKDQSDYVFDGTLNRISKKIENEYYTKSFSIPGLKIANIDNTGQFGNAFYMEYFKYGDYTTILGHTQIKKTTETLYDSQGDGTSIITQKDLVYDDVFQNLKKATTIKSNGTKEVAEFSYPKDYLLPTPIITDLKLKNIVGVPLESITKKVDNLNNEWIVSGKFNQFNNLDGKIHLSSNHSVKTNSPIPSTAFTLSTINSIFDSKYTKDVDFKYDATLGNIIEVSKPNDVPTSYIWGYSNTLPIIKATGVSYDILKTAYDAVAGDLTLIRNQPTLSNAFLNTYFYVPGVGLTKEIDPRGKNIYYEYDALNRLSLVRDNDNNILKKICYNYAGQPEDCPLTTSTAAVWRATGNTRCQPCPANNNYNSGVREKEEKDINPSSATYNDQPRWVVDPSGTCPTTPEYNPTGVQYCQQVGNVNTGSLVQETANVNPCAGAIGQPGPPIIIPNYGACIPCNPACLVSPQYMCINGLCVQGVLKVVKVRRISRTQWECTRAYCFPGSNGTVFGTGGYTIGPSTYTEVTIGTTACEIECF